jgi:hypothetical protein
MSDIGDEESCRVGQRRDDEESSGERLHAEDPHHAFEHDEVPQEDAV